MQDYKIAIIGLGYVGLPLAVEFGKFFPTIGFDIDQQRVAELANGEDKTLEVSAEELTKPAFLTYTNQVEVLADSNVYIITVPTPIDVHNHPDLTPLKKASATVGQGLKKGDIVIYESTVYPGATEEDCVPVLEQVSGLKFNEDFFVGYSPERIVPGDKERTLTKIRKITSGSTPEVAEQVDQLYQKIITAGTYKAPSLRVAEAAKVIENCQRDVNISFVNELALIFDKMGIDTREVLEAAGTKWNFLPFRPGLVGGHCISVDPYYLAMKAEQLGHHPAVILSGRRINDQMGAFVASKVVKLMVQKGIPVKDAPVLVLGITFKENCPDLRNSKVIDVITELKEFGSSVEVYDPWASKEEVHHEYGLSLIPSINKKYSAVILAVNHNEYLEMDVQELLYDKAVVFDVKGALPRDIVDARL
ncbi:nucleotide sugar dehydrogenase [Persicobacter psychrovividus]|uniref:UDP-glucose/GDP-mannose dehydrogenase n=1 Tax=Persicobacter psychrovividus TaxID=387638 RepID=A0ABM7VCD3_9BACT|nr:UDP-glucose/GDP-mannose dehydrogenase [Persicobacter psychrovividus]